MAWADIYRIYNSDALLSNFWRQILIPQFYITEKIRNNEASANLRDSAGLVLLV